VCGFAGCRTRTPFGRYPPLSHFIETVEHRYMSNDPSSGLPAAFFIFFAVYAVFLIVFVWAYVRIIRRAGYSGWWILIGLVPLLNVVMFLVFAFKEWPIQRELAQLRAQLGRQGGFPYGQPPGYGYPPPGPANPW
jgi:uncharacterized membrane protein YhaH (DUF805 family)